MTTVGGAPGALRVRAARTRTVVLNQLMLCAATIAVLGYVVLTGVVGNAALFLPGALLVLASGAVTCAFPRRVVGRGWVYAIPLIDIAAIGLMRLGDTTGGIGMLWMFPAMWMASISTVGFVLQLVIITGLYWTLLAFETHVTWAYTTFLLPLTLAAVSASSHALTRRFGAQQVLLDKQAAMLAGALKRAQRHEQLVTEVLDAVDFGVIRISADGEVGIVNEALSRIRQQIPAFGDLDADLGPVFGPDGTTPLEPEQRPLLRALRGESFDNLIVWFGAPGDRRFAYSMTVRRLRDTDGADAGCVLIARDITAELTALRARDRLVASVSHELRTPLTSVLGYIDLAIDNFETRPEAAKKDLEVAEKNGERLLAIVSDILAASSSSSLSMDMTVSPVEVDVSALVRSAAEGWRARAAERAIVIETDLVEPAHGYADPLRLRQVVDNLVSNAVKYNRDGGTVTLGCASDGSTTWIMVRDTGAGLGDADVARLFERYFRANSSVSGTGLGLSISRDIMRAHGGDLVVHSRLGIGSTFIASMPAGPERPDGSASTPPEWVVSASEPAMGEAAS